MNKMDALTAALESSGLTLDAADEARQRLAAIVESSDDAILSKNLDGIILSWNAGAERLFGYRPEEVVGKCVTILIPDDHLDEEPRILARIRRGERVEPYETMRQRKDGSLVDISLTVSPIKDASGRVIGASKIARDISERKRAEAALAQAAETQKLLVAELSHRVKNTLATVASIAEQSFSREQPVEHACQAFRERIRALGRTHERLAEASWSGVSFEAILLDELAPYRRADGRNIYISGPLVKLTPKQALTLGMAIHELTTNAAKYGALSTDQGNVHVDWRVDPEHRKIIIRWTEGGGPAMRSPRRSGFGRLLLERAVTADLRGDVRLDFAAEGLRCDIAVPLDDATMPAS
jgi:PAS domain S-box-containing protein